MNETKFSLARACRDALLRLYKPLDSLHQAVEGKTCIPSARLRIRVGSLDTFEGSSGEYVAYLKLLCGLKPEENFLDIGCGCGCTALSFTGQPSLSRQVNYYGCDVDSLSVKWCQKNLRGAYSSLPSDFRTQYPTHKSRQSLPYKSGSFDVVLMKSVATHLQPWETTRYLREISRVLQRRGTALLTFFLLCPLQEIFDERYGNVYKFEKTEKPASYLREGRPGLAVAYREDWLLEQIKIANLVVKDLHYGSWTGNPSGLSFQDILILEAK